MLEAMMESLAISEIVERRIKAFGKMKDGIAKDLPDDYKSVVVAAAFVRLCDVEIEMLNEVQGSNKRLGLALGRVAGGVA